MYKTTHQNAQRRTDALTPKNMAYGEQELTLEQQRESLASHVAQLYVEIKNYPKNHPKRKEIGAMIFEMNNQINTLRPRLRGNKKTDSYFIEVAKEVLPNFQFKLILSEAAKRAKVEEANNPKPTNKQREGAM